jgi:hypothetical protein
MRSDYNEQQVWSPLGGAPEGTSDTIGTSGMRGHPLAPELLSLAHCLRSAALNRSDALMAESCLDVATRLERLAAPLPANMRGPYEIEAIRKALSLQSKGAVFLLLNLMDARGGLLEHDELISAAACTRGTLKVYICNIRKKLGEMGVDDAIQTIWGVGYYITKTDSERIKTLLMKTLNM